MEKDHEEDKAEYSKVTDAFGQISFQTKFVNGLTELCGERKYYLTLGLIKKKNCEINIYIILNKKDM